jgi:hypothetical protein
MNKLLLAGFAGLLLSNLGAKGQSWAGSLPVDAASGKIVYRGSIVAPEIETTALCKRAKNYTYQAFDLSDTTRIITRTIFVSKWPANLHCQVAIKVVSGGYYYELSGFWYSIRAGEAFGPRGTIMRPTPDKFIGAEDQLETISRQAPGDLQTWQQQLAQAAQKTIGELQAAMR